MVRWTKWKSEGCQGYERKEVERLQPLAPSTVLQAAASTLSKSNRIETGSEALDRSGPPITHTTIPLYQHACLPSCTCVSCKRIFWRQIMCNAGADGSLSGQSGKLLVSRCNDCTASALVMSIGS